MKLPPEIRRTLRRLDKELADEFLAAFARIRGQAHLETIVGHLKAGNVDAALVALRIDPVFFQPLDRALSEAYYRGGVQALAALPALPDPFGGGAYLFSFDGRHPRAETWVRQKSSEWIVKITTEQTELIRARLVQGMSEGRGPASMALDIVGRIDPVSRVRTGGVLGLSPGQIKWVDTAREQLQSGDPAQLRAYLQRELRDRRYDGVVERAIASGKPVPPEQLGRAVRNYENRVLRYRGETVARTESINAYRAGRHEGYMQLSESGVVKQDQIVRVWRSTGDDGRTRDDHLEMDGSEGGTVRGMEAPFTLPDGNRLMFPGDDSLGAPPEQTIQCRCFEEVTIDFLAEFL